MWRSAGRQEPRPPRVAVIGAGIAGLAAAHRLQELARDRRRAVEVRLLEAAARPGGSIATEHTPDGFVIEHGPDSFLTEKPEALRLCRRLGLEEELQGTREEFRRTSVVRGGRLCPLPEGFLLLAPNRFWPLVFSPLFSWRGKMRMALDLVLPARPRQGDESLASFVRRRLGREALERVAQPLVGGIYTADPERLSLAATMPRFLELERQHRSIILGLRRQSRASATAGSGARWGLFAAPRRGLGRLVEALTAALPPGTLMLRTPAHGIRRTERETWIVNGNLECEALILACPAWAAASLLKDVDAQAAASLAALPYASSAVVTLAWRREDIPHPLDAFGFVVPFVEGRRILACTFANLKYEHRAPPEFVLTRVFIGGELQPELLEREDHELVEMARGELAALLGVRAEPVLHRLRRHPRAMAVPHVGHWERVARIRRRLAAIPRLAVAGSAWDGIGIPNCVRSGEQAAEVVFGMLEAKEGPELARTAAAD